MLWALGFVLWARVAGGSDSILDLKAWTDCFCFSLCSNAKNLELILAREGGQAEQESEQK